MFELLSEYHLPQEQIESNQSSFMAMFSESLKDSQTRVRASTLKATMKFLSMFEDEDQVLQYAQNMSSLLDIVVEVIRDDEEQGKESLESLIELTNLFGEIWSACGQKLIYICAEIMKNKDFEDGTRESALELIASVAEAHPKLLKDN